MQIKCKEQKRKGESSIFWALIYLDTDEPIGRHELTYLRYVIPERENHDYFDSFHFVDKNGHKSIWICSNEVAKNCLAKLEIFKTLKEKIST